MPMYARGLPVMTQVRGLGVSGGLVSLGWRMDSRLEGVLETEPLQLRHPRDECDQRHHKSRVIVVDGGWWWRAFGSSFDLLDTVQGVPDDGLGSLLFLVFVL